MNSSRHVRLLAAYVVVGFSCIGIVNSFPMPWDPVLRQLFAPWAAVSVVAAMWGGLALFAIRPVRSLSLRFLSFTVFLIAGLFWKGIHAVVPTVSLVLGAVCVALVVLVNFFSDQGETADR